MQNLNSINDKIPWLTFIILLVMFYLIDGHELSRAKTDESDGTVASTVSKVEEGRIERRIGLFGLTGLAVISLMKKSSNKIKIKGYLGWLLILFMTWAFYSLAWADNIGLVSRRIMVLFMFFIIGLAMARQFSIRNLLVWIFFATACYALIGLLAEIIFGKFRPLLADYRFAGTLHPNHQGINCSLLLISGVILLDYFKRARKFSIAILVISAVLLIATKSRTSFISTLMALSIYWSMRSSRSKKLSMVTSLIIICCTLLLVVGEALFPAFQDAALLGRESDSESVYSLTERVPLWKTCFKYIERRPLQGYGYGGFWTEQNIREISRSEKWLIGESHSAYVELALGLGIIGVILYLLLLIGGIQSSLVNYRNTHNTGYVFSLLVLVFCIVDGFLESAIVFPGLIMFLIFFILIHISFIILPMRKGVVTS